MKPNKSILKRIKVTKNGKLVRRRAGHNHYNAKASRRSQRRHRASALFPEAFRREIIARI